MRRLVNYGSTGCAVLFLSLAISITGLGRSLASGAEAKVQQVFITNRPLPVSAPAAPVQFGGKVSLTGSNIDKAQVVYTVPAGKELVIEYVAASFPAQPLLGLIGVSTGKGPIFYLTLGHEPNCLTGCHFWMGSEQIHLYAKAGKNVIVHDTGGELSGTISFSGYLVKA